jgi:hypothetical protein
MDSETRSEADQDHAQVEARVCAYCHTLFAPKRLAQGFCSQRCRAGYHVDIGTMGKVASVRRINRGASVVIHLEGPAAEAALKLELRQKVRVVK